MPTLEDVIPSTGFPRSVTPIGKDPHWLLHDDKGNFRKRRGHPIYGERDIVYRFNRHGYRAPEFDTPGEIRMISIGEETTMGFALPQEHSFPELVANRLRSHLGKSVVHWNLSSTGASGDYVSRVLHLVVPKLQPHLALVMFPPLGRREFMTAHGHLIPYLPGVTGWDAVSRDVYRNFDILASQNDDQFSFYRNYKSVETALYDCEWVFGLINSYEVTFAGPHCDPSRRIAALGEKSDVARDHASPGPKTYVAMADLFWDKLSQSGSLDRIATLSDSRERSQP